jgi:hypothetical protein
MSWGASVSSKLADELFDSLDESFNAFYGDAAPSVREQYEAAKDVVDRLLSVVSGEAFTCSMGGHSQEADPNSSLDHINVSLAAVAAPAVTEEVATADEPAPTQEY